MAERPLSIALFSDSLFPIQNGVSVSIDALVEQLRGRGHSVHVFSSRYPGHVDIDPNTHRFFSIHTPWSKDYPLAVPPFYPWLREFRRARFDLIHCHTPFTVGLVGLRWAESHEIPVVATYHTNYDKYAYYMTLVPKRYLRYRIAKHTNYYYNRVQQVITPSDASQRWLLRHSIKRPITVIPTGVPTPRMIDRSEARQQLAIPADHKIALYVGRIAREKNLGTLLQAMVIAFKEDSRLQLWLVGDGPARQEYSRMARQLGIGDRIKFVGFVPREDVDTYYAACDVFTFTSMTETQGLVIAEAMTYGLPALVVKGGGAGEAVEPGVNGFLLRNEPVGFAERLKEVLSNDGLYMNLSEGARRISRQFGVGVMSDRVLEVYSAALGTERVAQDEAYVR